MNKRIKKIIITYFLFVLLFVLQKPLFMGYNHTLYKNCTLTDYLSVMFHGLPLDLSVAGYLTIIPAFLLIFSVWTNSKALYRIKQLYFGIISLLLSIIFIVNTGLYSFWEFPLDYSPLFYFFSSPKLAAASVSYGYVIVAILTIIIYATLLFTIFYLFLIRQKVLLKIPYYRIKESFILLVLTGVLFLPIRGGIGVSTMNIGKAFYSQDQFLNHAAVNPVFSLNASLAHQNNFDKQYQYFKPAIADSLFSQLVDKPVSDSIPQLLNTKRPNIIFVILESFSTYIMKTMGGLPNVAINMDQYAQEGVLFTHCYANSFRTDRGLAAILSAYPAQPNTSIMKYPEKTAHLPSLIRTLQDNGYQTEYYYGGDADFTNKRSFLLSSGIEKLISESDFPINMHLNNKWGVPDGPLFNRAMEDLKKEKNKQPFLKIIQTLSSHEPFDVPFHRLNDKVLNAFAYTDSCLGNFIENYKRTKYWKNTLIIL
ncbi:MAG: sulfatase-like hydrolase/transferase, partial [Bacteroidaceae bacterium]